MKFVLDTIEFNTDVADADGALWYLDRVEGWDSPAQRQTTVEPTSRHGVVVTQDLLGARALVMGGVCKVETGGEAAFWNAYNGLLGTVGRLGTGKPLTGTEDVDKTLLVRKASEVRVTIHPGWFEFEVNLIAPDPLKYAVLGTTVSINPGVTKTLFNTGSYASDKIVALAQSAGSTRLTHLGTTRYVATSAVTSGCAFDYHNRTIFGNSINQYGTITSSSVWWSLEPGANQIRNDGAVAMSLNYYAAWV